MGCWILYDSDAQRAVYYDSTSESALGVVSFIGADAAEQAGSFLGYLCTDHHRAAYGKALPRYPENPFDYPGGDLDAAHDRWKALTEDADGNMNEYGWTLYEWQEARPAYGPRDTLNAAPEPGELDALDDPSETEIPL